MKTNRSGFFWILASCVALSGCETPSFLESEMKGMLTVDKRQYGNEMLEVTDIDSNLTRFIRPGKKIIEISPGKSGTYDLRIYDSRRVQLARIVVPTKGSKIDEKSIEVPSSLLGQPFGIQGKRTPLLLRRDYVVKRGKDCKLPCQRDPKKTCDGSTGSIWEVDELRYDYVLNFMNEASGKPMGVFTAIGRKEVVASSGHIDECRPKALVYPAPKGAFE